MRLHSPCSFFDQLQSRDDNTIFASGDDLELRNPGSSAISGIRLHWRGGSILAIAILSGSTGAMASQLLAHRCLRFGFSKLLSLSLKRSRRGNVAENRDNFRILAVVSSDFEGQIQ